MLSKFRNKTQGLAVRALNKVDKITNKISTVSKDQRGELPYWVNVVGVIAVIVVIVLIVYKFLPAQVQTLIQTQIDKMVQAIT